MTLKNLSFLSIISFIIIIQFLKSIIKKKLNQNNFDINSLKNILNKKNQYQFSKHSKKMIKKSDFINIVEINASIYYFLIRNKENKLFSLTINKIYNTLYKTSSTKIIQKNNRISFNKSCLYDFKIKYKKYYKSYTLKIAQFNNAKIFILE